MFAFRDVLVTERSRLLSFSFGRASGAGRL
jgi:hypothetical protein